MGPIARGDNQKRMPVTSAEARRKSLIVPREHGAWGILLVPLVTGAAVGLLAGGRSLPLAPLVMAALALFWLRTPVENWVGTAPTRARTPGEVAAVRNASLALGAVAVAALAWLFWGGRNGALLWIGAASAAAFVIQALVRAQWRTARTAAQTVGAAGLTAVAPAAYCTVTGALNSAAWALWIANLLFAFNQIQYVHLRIQAARAADTREKLAAGRGFLAGQIALIAILVAACALGLFPWLPALAFLPLLIRGFTWFAARPKPLVIHALGRQELYHAIGFGVLLVLGFAA